MQKLVLSFFYSFTLNFFIFCTCMAADRDTAPLPEPNPYPAEAVVIDQAAFSEHKDTIDGFEREWWVYQPKRIASQKAPLVVGLHGFGGLKDAYRNAWAQAAERFGFIAVLPKAVAPKQWNIWEMESLPQRPDDVKFLNQVLDETIKEYPVDEERIYLSGVSMGDNMATTWAFRDAERFAAIAPTDGPTLPSILVDEKTGQIKRQPQTAVPSLRLHGEADVMAGIPSTYQQHKITNAEYQAAIPMQDKKKLRYSMDELIKKIWLDKNGVKTAPAFHLDSARNIAFYKGEGNKDLVSYTMVGEGHGEGYNRDERVWPHMLYGEFLSGYKKTADGKGIEHIQPAIPVAPDVNALAIAANASKVYLNNNFRDIPRGSAVMRGGNLYLPVDFLPTAFPGCSITIGNDGKNAVLTYPGNTQGETLNIVAGQPLGLVFTGNKEEKTATPFMDNGQLMAPVGAVAPFLGLSYAQNDGAGYAADHPVHLTFDFASTFKSLLGAEKNPVADINVERAIVDRILKGRGSKNQ